MHSGHEWRGVITLSWLVIICSPMSGVAQVSARQNCDTAGVDTLTFKRLIQERFSALLNPSSDGVPGTYAAVDLKDAAATFAGSSTTRSGLAIVIKAHGGTTDGLLSAINNQTVNPKFGAELQLHFLGKKGQSVQFSERACTAYYAAVRKANEDYDVRKVEIDSNYEQTLRTSAIAALDKKMAKIKTLLDSEKVAYVRDSLGVELSKARLLKGQVLERPPKGNQELSSRQQKSSDLRKALSILDVLGFRVRWWSLTYGIENTTFRLFNSSLAADSQVTKRSYLSHQIGLSYSNYTLPVTRVGARYWSIGTHLSLENDLNVLTKVDLTDRTSYGTNPVERVSEKNYTAYVGKYSDNLKTLRFTGDYYDFSLLNGEGAFHLFPVITLKDEVRPAYATGFGILLAVRKEAQKESVVNAELYFNLPDLTNSQNTGKRFFSRNDLGLRFSFPISFGSGA